MVALLSHVLSHGPPTCRMSHALGDATVRQMTKSSVKQAIRLSHGLAQLAPGATTVFAGLSHAFRKLCVMAVGLEFADVSVNRGPMNAEV